MTPDKILEVVARYETLLSAYGDDAKRYDKYAGGNLGRVGRRQHLNYMTAEIRKFVAEGSTEKAFRWLGFMQGVLWADGHYTVEQLGEHNKP